MSGLVELAEVIAAGSEGDALAEHHLDRPTGSEEDGSDTYALPLEGWAIGRDGPIEAVEVVHDGTSLWRGRLESGRSRPDVGAAFPQYAGSGESGFGGAVNTLRLPSDFELEVAALLGDGSRAPIAELRGRRARLRPELEPRLAPLMVTTFGRSGSTVLVRALGTHPAIAAYRAEPRLLTYWTDVLRALSDPTSYRRQIAATQRSHERAWWLGGPPLPAPLPEPELERLLGADSVSALVRLCQERVDSAYLEIASRRGRDGATMFAEKCSLKLPELAWEIYPGARELILVRDFRDMVSSVLSYNRGTETQAFGRASFASDEQYVERIGAIADRFVRSWHGRRQRSRLVRYEDLVLRPRETLAAVLDYLELDAGAGALDAMVDAVAEPAADRARHLTSGGGLQSVGRFRRDLDAAVREACERAFAPALEAFGYDEEPAS